MKKKVILVAMVLVCLTFSMLSLIACSDKNVETYGNLMIKGEIYFDGEQTVNITMEEWSADKTTFKESIAPTDISVEGVLTGKKVKSVKYIDAENITVTFTGKVTADKSQAKELAKVVISHNALSNNANGEAYVYVNFEPKITTSFANVSIVGKKGTYVSEFVLPYGSFIEENVNANNIQILPSGLETEINITEEGKLKIKVKDFEAFSYGGVEYKYPIAKINANVTTFNKDIYLRVGIGINNDYALV